MGKICVFKQEKGSVLILAIVATFILSLTVIGLLSVGNTEIQTTQNHYLNKKAYYYAIEGLEDVIDRIRNSDDPTSIFETKVDTSSTSAIETLLSDSDDELAKTYYTGDMQNGQRNVSFFKGFAPPPLPAISLGDATGLIPIVYRVPITSEVILGTNKRAYTEIIAGVYATARKN
jgi:hypothetical protein